MTRTPDKVVQPNLVILDSKDLWIDIGQTSVSGRCLIHVDPKVFAIWDNTVVLLLYSKNKY